MTQPPGNKVWQYAILGLVALGFLVQLFQSPMSILIPLIIIGLVYYLYKFPPRWLLRLSSSSRPFSFSQRHKQKKSKRKKRPFRVIDGNKKETL